MVRCAGTRPYVQAARYWVSRHVCSLHQARWTPRLPGRQVTTNRITLAELEQHLGKAADLLRGSIDQADFKAYIFPMMFFKRISDVYEEEFARALDDSGGDHEFAAFAENHRFAIPDGNRWSD